MNRFILLCSFILNCCISYAQDTTSCDSYITKTVDKFNGRTYITAKDFIVIPGSGKESAKLVMMKAQKSMVLDFEVKPATCVDEGAEIDIVFDDNSRENVVGSQKFNCTGSFNIYIGGVFGNRDLGKSVGSKKITAIRFHAMSTFYDFEVPKEIGELISKSYSCLLNYKSDQ